MFSKKALVTAVAALALPLAASAERVELGLGALYGINEVNGSLIRYDFYTDNYQNLGKLKLSSGHVLTGVKAAAYRQGYQTLLAFWTDPATNEVKVVNVDLATGAATLRPYTLDVGTVTGAATVRVPDAAAPSGKSWAVYVLQHAEKVTAATAKVQGAINLNPNNSPHNEFRMEMAGGTTLTLKDGSVVNELSRDDLKNNVNFDGDGVVFSGTINRVVVKPKGNGNQNSLMIDDQVHMVENAKTYVFEGAMDVVVWNSHIHNGKAMGHWWISISATDVTINGEEKTEVINHLVKVDPDTGLSEHIMPLDETYDGLAGDEGGEIFYATKEDKLFKIDVTTGTTTPVGTIDTTSSTGLEKVIDDLLVYDDENNRVRPIDQTTGAWTGPGVSVDIDDLGTIFYVDPSYDPLRFDQRVSYD